MQFVVIFQLLHMQHQICYKSLLQMFQVIFFSLQAQIDDMDYVKLQQKKIHKETRWHCNSTMIWLGLECCILPNLKYYLISATWVENPFYLLVQFTPWNLQSWSVPMLFKCVHFLAFQTFATTIVTYNCL
jgi:hypothetical protein